MICSIYIYLFLDAVNVSQVLEAPYCPEHVGVTVEEALNRVAQQYKGARTVEVTNYVGGPL